MSDSESKPQRRWFRFGLRTLFVVLTVVSLLFGFQASWVKQRRSFVAEQRTVMRRAGLDYNPYTMANNQIRAPQMAWVIGEHGIARMFVAFEKGQKEQTVQRAKSLFPEATIIATFELPSRGPSLINSLPTPVRSAP